MEAPALNPETNDAAGEKSRVAVSSVLAAVFLTVTKIVVGLLTGSLGILSEAAHSALDLVAAIVTVFAVKTSARPADENHPYGHGRVENLAALFETALLLATCAWIVWEAVHRLSNPVPVKASIWGFVVIGVSIFIDFSRSRALDKVAKKYGSQALEADALHFKTDIWSSCVVLFGLGCVWFSGKFQIPWLIKADAIAALAVAGIVIWVSVELGAKTIRDLMDEVPKGLVTQAKETVAKTPGVLLVPRLRVRRMGGEWFSDVVIQVDPALTTHEAHLITDTVEHALSKILQGGDIVIHTEPAPLGEPTI